MPDKREASARRPATAAVAFLFISWMDASSKVAEAGRFERSERSRSWGDQSTLSPCPAWGDSAKEE